MDFRFTDIATIRRPARAAVAPTIATLKSVHTSSASGMPALYSRPCGRGGGMRCRVRHIAGGAYAPPYDGASGDRMRIPAPATTPWETT